MSEHAHGSHAAGVAEHPHEPHSDSYYIKIWGILMVLLIISIAGPALGMPIVTLITAFGIAIIKTGIVCAYFMHLNIEKKYIWYLLIIALTLVGVFFFGTASDILKPEGRNWHDCVHHEAKQVCYNTPLR